MKLSELCIRRPVFATVLSLVLVVVGILGYQRLQWRFEPAIFKPTLVVQTSYLGASPAQIEQSITTPLENSLEGIPDVEFMLSRSQQGQSTVVLHFSAISKQEFIIDQSQVLQAIASVSLPDAASKPQIYGADQGQNQLLFIGVTDPKLNAAELSAYANNVLAKQLQEVPGVGEVDVWGINPALRISVHPLALARWHLTVDDVVAALNANNIALPVGQLLTSQIQIPLNTALTLPNVDAFKTMIVANQNGHLVRLSDVATVAVSDESIAGDYSEVNGKNGDVIAISYADNANPVSLGQAVRQRVVMLQQHAPSGMHITSLIDFSVVLQDSLQEVVLTVFEAILLVVLVTFAFLGNVRATLIPIVTIPVCLTAAFAIMFALGFSINVMTLLAFVLGVGLVVDDAIVVMENTHRHLEAGMAPIAAAQLGIREVGFVIVAMTICLLAVYMPIGFVSGDLATFFQEFGFTLAGAILISGFVALTLSPMMCSQVLRYRKTSSYEHWLEQFVQRLRSGYGRLLQGVLRRRGWLIGVFVALLGLGYWAFNTLPTALMPKSDAGIVINFLQGPQIASIEGLFAQNSILVAKIRALPDVQSVVSFASNRMGGAPFNVIQLTPWNKRTASTDQVAAQISAIEAKMPGITGGAFALDLDSNDNMFSPGSMTFYVAGMTSYDNLIHAANQLVTALGKLPSITNVSATTGSVSQQYDLSIRREVASRLYVPLPTITDTLAALYGGERLDQGYQVDGVTYPIVVQLPKADLADFSALNQIYVQNSLGTPIALSRLLIVKPVIGTAMRSHYAGLRAVAVNLTVNTAKGYTAGSVIDQVNATAHAVLPGNMQLEYTDSVLKMLHNNNSLTMVFGCGLIFIYLVLAALFESFVDPLIILLTVPLSVVGALVVLLFTGGSLNMLTGIGLVTLIGLVSKHGVLITRFANERLQQGMAPLLAVVEAATIRLRPILMTTSTMVLGALPLLFATGPGAASRLQLGVVIVGGLLLGTLFSLFVVPLAYVLLKKRRPLPPP